MIASLFLSLFLTTAALPNGVRNVTATSCEKVRVNLALGMTTQIIFEQPPVQTLHADEQHFRIKSSPDANRSIAIIPYVEENVLQEIFRSSGGRGTVAASNAALASKLDQIFNTNLFVIFKNANQLMFELRFVEKSKADFILNVKQSFRKDCQL